MVKIIESKTELRVADDEWKNIIYINTQSNEFYLDISRVNSKNFPRLNTIDYINNIIYRIRSLMEVYDDDVIIGEYSGRKIYVCHSYDGKLIIKIKYEDENTTYYKRIIFNVINNGIDWLEYYLNKKVGVHTIQGNDTKFHDNFIIPLINTIRGDENDY